MVPNRFWLVLNSIELDIQARGYGESEIDINLNWEFHNAVFLLKEKKLRLKVFVERAFLGGQAKSFDELGVLEIPSWEYKYKKFSQGVNLSEYDVRIYNNQLHLKCQSLWPGYYTIALELYFTESWQAQVMATGFLKGNPIHNQYHNHFHNRARIEHQVDIPDPNFKSGKKHAYRIGNTNLARYKSIVQNIRLFEHGSGKLLPALDVDHTHGFPIFSPSRSVYNAKDVNVESLCFYKFSHLARAKIKALLRTVHEASLFYHLSAPLISSLNNPAAVLNAVKRSLYLTNESRKGCIDALENTSVKSKILGLRGTLIHGFPKGLGRDPNNIKNLCLAARYWYELSDLLDEVAPEDKHNAYAKSLDLLVNACLRLEIINKLLNESILNEDIKFMIDQTIRVYYDLDARNELHTPLAYSGLSDILRLDLPNIERRQRELNENGV